MAPSHYEAGKEWLGDALVKCLSEATGVLDKEMRELCDELSERVGLRFASFVAEACGSLHAENKRLRQQLPFPDQCKIADSVERSLEECDSPKILLGFRSETAVQVDDASQVTRLSEESQKLGPSACSSQATQSLIRNESALTLIRQESQGSFPARKKRKSLKSISSKSWEIAFPSLSPAADDGEGELSLSLDSAEGVMNINRIPPWWLQSLVASHGPRHVSHHGLRGALEIFVQSRAFDLFFCIVIIMDSMTLGLEAEQSMKGPSSNISKTALHVAANVFTALYVIEMICKFVAFGYQGFTPSFPDGYWNISDAFLTLTAGVVLTWCVPLFLDGSDIGSLRSLVIIRCLRVWRMVRVVRTIPQFREAWLLLRGLSDSMRILFWTCVVIFFITYVFAVAGLLTIGREITDKRDHAKDLHRQTELSDLLEYVGSLNLLMYTLFQLLTLDSWNAIVRPMKQEIGWCWVYFYAYICVGVFVLMNLVTASIVENAFSKAQHDEVDRLQEYKRKQNSELAQLQLLFDLMDADSSGSISCAEFKEAFDDPEICNKWRMLDFAPSDCRELFTLLDPGNGQVEADAFFEGLTKMKGDASAIDVFRLQKSVDNAMAMIEEMHCLQALSCKPSVRPSAAPGAGSATSSTQSFQILPKRRGGRPSLATAETAGPSPSPLSSSKDPHVESIREELVKWALEHNPSSDGKVDVAHCVPPTGVRTDAPTRVIFKPARPVHGPVTPPESPRSPCVSD